MFPSGTEGVKQCESNGEYGTWNTAIFGYANCMLSAYIQQKVIDMLVLILENAFDKKITPSFLLKVLFQKENCVQQ